MESEHRNGYWKYIPQKEDVYFYTWYDYKTRFGFFGKVVDRFIFRPIMGWATAWSFDCLRLWVEKEISPRLSVLRLLIQSVCLFMLSFVWLYQGLVPKLLFQDSGEKELIGILSFLHGHESWILYSVVSQPHVFVTPFNPFTLNLLMIGLFIIGVIMERYT
jgi:hypothetical protein